MMTGPLAGVWHERKRRDGMGDLAIKARVAGNRASRKPGEAAWASTGRRCSAMRWMARGNRRWEIMSKIGALTNDDLHMRPVEARCGGLKPTARLRCRNNGASRKIIGAGGVKLS